MGMIFSRGGGDVTLNRFFSLFSVVSLAKGTFNYSLVYIKFEIRNWI